MNLGRSVGLLALLLALYILWQIRQVLLLFFTAVVLATSLNQLARQFQHLGIRRGWSVILNLGILFITFVIFTWLVVPSFVRQFQELVTLLPTTLRVIQNVVNWLLANSAAVIIGAMIIAPLMLPIRGLAFGASQGNVTLFRKGLMAVAIGSLLAVALAWSGLAHNLYM